MYVYRKNNLFVEFELDRVTSTNGRTTCLLPKDLWDLVGEQARTLADVRLLIIELSEMVRRAELNQEIRERGKAAIAAGASG